MRAIMPPFQPGRSLTRLGADLSRFFLSIFRSPLTCTDTATVRPLGGRNSIVAHTVSRIRCYAANIRKEYSERQRMKGLETMEDRLLYPFPEAMHRLGIGRTTLYGLIDTGELVRVNIGRKALIDGASIDAYIERLRQTD
jgi:excisionase family DNA binding protein